MRYYPALDGLRALSVMAVLAFHAGAPFAGAGYLGVDLFFVLSGFLIASILRDEQMRAGHINVVRFYLHRALRLYPTLLLMLVAFLVTAPHLWPELPAWRYAAWAALYLSDYARAFLGEPVVLSYTWSLSVEEHFYLLLPLVLPAIIRTGRPAKVLAIAWVVATLWRIGNYAWLGWEPTYFRFDTRTSGLILGCLLAFWKPDVSHYRRHAGVLLVALIPLPIFHAWQGLTLATTAAEIGSAVLILSAVSGGAWAWLQARWLAYIGRLSYGIYIWHFPLIYVLREQLPWNLTLLLTTAFSVAAAAATYHWVDVPLRRLRTTGRTKAQSELPAGLQ